MNPYQGWDAETFVRRIAENLAEIAQKEKNIAAMQKVVTAGKHAAETLPNLLATAITELQTLQTAKTAMEAAQKLRTAVVVAETSTALSRLATIGRCLGVTGRLAPLAGGAAVGVGAFLLSLFAYFVAGALGTAMADDPVEAGPRMAEHRADLRDMERIADPTTDPTEKERLIERLEGGRDVVIPDLPAFSGERFGIYVAGKDVFVGQKSVIENASVASVVLWGVHPTNKVKNVATVKNALAENKTFGNAADAWKAYKGIKKNVKRAHSGFVSHGKLGRFENAPDFGIQLDPSVLASDRWYAVNNEDRFLVR